MLSLRDALHRAAVAVRALDENRQFDVETKGDNTPLTTADLAANSILRESLTAIDPEAGWLSEENEDDPVRRMNHNRVWIVDPIDGTREFVDGTGEYSISAGLAIGGEADLGGVALPRENLIVLGARGIGLQIWRYDADGIFEAVPGNPGDSNKVTDLKHARILVSKSEMKRGAYSTIVDELQLIPAGSIARKMALVAIGRADLVISLYPKSEWDICGGAALIRCLPGSLLIELEHTQKQRFNQAHPRTIGLAGGHAALVREFDHYRQAKKLTLRHSYD